MSRTKEEKEASRKRAEVLQADRAHQASIDPRAEDGDWSNPLNAPEIIEWFSGHHKEKFENWDYFLNVVKNGHFKTYSKLWDNILDHGFFYKFRDNAWVSRSGKAYTCGFAKHDWLARILTEDGVRDLEDAGWLRVTGSSGRPLRVQGKYRPTSKQMRFLKLHGLEGFVTHGGGTWMVTRIPSNAPVIKDFE